MGGVKKNHGMGGGVEQTPEQKFKANMARNAIFERY